MAKLIRDYRIVADRPIKEVNTERSGDPFLRRVNQENIREAELAGQKSKLIRSAPVASGNSGTLAQDTAAIIELTLTANDANVIVAWPQINIYVDTDGAIDSLWFRGADVTLTDANLQLGWVQLINTQTYSGLGSNQAVMQGILTNRDTSSHTYYIYVRWLYMIIE